MNLSRSRDCQSGGQHARQAGRRGDKKHAWRGIPGLRWKRKKGHGILMWGGGSMRQEGGKVAFL